MPTACHGMAPRISDVEIRLAHASGVQPVAPRARSESQLAQIPVLDRSGRAMFRARGRQVRLEAVVAEGALPGPAVVVPAIDDPEGACGDAVPAAVADVRLHVHAAELRADDGPGGTSLEASGARAVLADVGHHEPGEARKRSAQRHRPLHEGDVPPRRRSEMPGVVVRTAGAAEAVVGELVPLLARHFAGLAPDAE